MTLSLDPLHGALFRDHRIEVPVLTCPAHPDRLLRISAQAYNSIANYERLALAREACSIEPDPPCGPNETAASAC